MRYLTDCYTCQFLLKGTIFDAFKKTFYEKCCLLEAPQGQPDGRSQD